MNAVHRILLAVVACAVVGCATSPAYQKPAIDMPPAWKTEEPWRKATRSDVLRVLILAGLDTEEKPARRKKGGAR